MEIDTGMGVGGKYAHDSAHREIFKHAARAQQRLWAAQSARIHQNIRIDFGFFHGDRFGHPSETFFYA